MKRTQLRRRADDIIKKSREYMKIVDEEEKDGETKDEEEKDEETKEKEAIDMSAEIAMAREDYFDVVFHNFFLV